MKERDVILKLVQILKDVVWEQANRERSGTDWAQEKFDELNRLHDEIQQLEEAK